ncbi:MAG: hypothetical protein J6X53_03560, partial [Abditibacteriota bacterium]|nr:hypothetical protein [Abditibacteriota bacterium]
MAKRDSEIRKDIADFIEKWMAEDTHSEKQESGEYWRDLMEAFFDKKERPRPTPEKHVRIGTYTHDIDRYYPEALILVENKSTWVDLDKKERQS